MDLKISYGSSRFAKQWVNKTITWEALKDRLSVTHRTPETAAQYANMGKSEQGDVKDVGGFVGGHLAQGRRKKNHAVQRSLITLDADFPSKGFLTRCHQALEGHEWAAYSTHSHTPKRPRLRLIVPLATPVDAQAYEPAARALAARIGINDFDDTTFEAHRLMYWPSTPSDGQYIYETGQGVLLDPADLLAEYKDWRDTATWPVSTRQIRAVETAAKKQADPLAKPGIVGAFCRAHTIASAIETFLADVYQPSKNSPERYDYIPGESVAGLVVYDHKFAYSHHSTDPVSGKLVNAFDLVRIHMFGNLDDETSSGASAKSFEAMSDFAAKDPETKHLLGQEQAAKAQDFKVIKETIDAANWRENLDVKKDGAIKDTLPNLVTITKNDPFLSGIAFNMHRDGIDVHPHHPVPWDQVKPGWSESDNAQLKNYLQTVYGLYSPAKTKDALLIAAADRAYHPVKQWLEGLPEWDGLYRLDHLLTDYLGAEDNEYTRAVIRKTLVAAVARIYKPGTKFDSVLILEGPQGCGKSTLFARLGQEWFSDSLTLTDMKDKTGAEKLQGYWILELGELSGMRKTDVEIVKSFLSRTDDKYRAAYGTNVESHPRQCVIVGTTNAQDGFLRDITGNRRFWPVKVTGTSPIKPWDLDQFTVKQIWAEALTIYRGGENLYLSGTAAEIAASAQSSAMETDEREGIVREFLEAPVPQGWEDMTVYERNTWLRGEEFGGDPGPGHNLTKRATVSNIEIWVECFGRDKAGMRPQDSYQISSIMEKIEDWERSTKLIRCAAYGRQRVYRRVEQPTWNSPGTTPHRGEVVPPRDGTTTWPP